MTRINPQGPQAGRSEVTSVVESVDVERLRELAVAATPGPWEWWHEDGEMSLMSRVGREPSGDPHVLTGHVCEACRKRGAPCLNPSDADAAYIAAVAPTTILELLNGLASLRTVR